MIAKNYTLSVLTAAIVRRPVIRVLIARSIEVTASMKYNSRACLKNAFWHMYPKGMICFTVCTLKGMIWRILPEFRRCTQRAWYSGLHWLNLGKILRIMPFRVQSGECRCREWFFKHALVYCIVDICQNSETFGAYLVSFLSASNDALFVMQFSRYKYIWNAFLKFIQKKFILDLTFNS